MFNPDSPFAFMPPEYTSLPQGPPLPVLNSETCLQGIPLYSEISDQGDPYIVKPVHISQISVPT